MFDKFNHHCRNRHRFLGIAAITLAFALFGEDRLCESAGWSDSNGRPASDESATDAVHSDSITCRR
jgi:hypothetical protein